METKRFFCAPQYSNYLLCCLCLCGFFLCINPKISNIFQILSYLVFIPFLLKNKRFVLERFNKFKVFFYLYFLYAVFELIPVFFSPEFGVALKIWTRTYLLRGTLFLLVLLCFKERKQYLLLFLSLISSYTIDSLACIALGPNPDYDNRVTGFYGHPMIYAGFSCIVIPFFIYKLIVEKTWHFKLLYLFINVFFVSLLILNGTRGAWVALFFVFIALLSTSKLSFKNFLLFISIAFFVSLVSYQASPQISYRIKTLSDPQMHLQSERILLWKSSFEMFKDHPLTGVGLGAYKEQYQQKYMSPMAKEKTLTRAHSNIFQLLGESGLVGLIGYIVITFGLLYKSFSLFYLRKKKEGIIVAASILCLFIQGLTEYNLGHSSVMKFYWLWLGVLFSLGYLSDEDSNSL